MFQCRIKRVLIIQTQRKDQKDHKHLVNMVTLSSFSLMSRTSFYFLNLGKSKPLQFVSNKMEHV